MTNVQELRTIKYSQSDGNAQVWPFTTLDRNLFRLIIRGTWLFRRQLDVEQLSSGLEKVLSFYPHLSGRINWKSGVQLINAGIPFIIDQQKDITLDSIINSPASVDQYSEPLDSKKMKSGEAACMSVKLTHVDDGTVLGVRCLHSLLDGAAFYGMIENWARQCRGQAFDLPVVDQSLFPVSNPLPSIKELEKKALASGFARITLKSLFTLIKMSISKRKFRRSAGFYLSKETLDRMRKRISDESGFECSTNEALSAFIIKKCITLNSHTNMKMPYSSVHVIDTRGRVPSLKPAFAGNAALALTTATFQATASEAMIARQIHDGIARYLPIPSPGLTDIMTMTFDLMALKKPYVTFDFERSFGNKPTAVYINNFHRMPIYKVDFGTGVPYRVIPHDLEDPVLFWPAPADKGGIEVYFTGSFEKTISKLSPDNPWFDFSV